MFIKLLRKPEYVGWNAYKRKIDFLSEFWFQQDVRAHNSKIS